MPKGEKLSVFVATERQLLDGAGAPTERGKHLLAGHYHLDRPVHLTGRNGGQYTMAPKETLRAERASDERTDTCTSSSGMSSMCETMRWVPLIQRVLS